MVLRITQYGEPILREVGKPVIVFDNTLRQLARDMIETMHEADGAGLAAQQVGKALQMFVMDIGSDGRPVEFFYTLDDRAQPLPLIMPMVVCNPSIKPLDQGLEASDEGCLSFPGMTVQNIERDYAIRMRFQDLDGVWHVLVCDGFLARCCQHEYDHLQGKLFIDRVPKAQLRKHESKLKRFKRESRDFLKEKSE